MPRRWPSALIGASRFDVIADGLVHRGPISAGKVAGHYLALTDQRGRLTVIDLDTGEREYTAKIPLPRGSSASARAISRTRSRGRP